VRPAGGRPAHGTRARAIARGTLSYDAVVVVSFGGPEGPDDVLPFLENVTRGRAVPAERLRQVAKQYEAFGGVSPINGLNRQLVAALRGELAAKGPDLPVYLGNRNWHPFLADTLREMEAAGIRRAAAFVTSAYGSYSSCRQYLDDIVRARAEVGSGAPEVDKLRLFFNHPGFIEPMADHLRLALAQVTRSGQTRVLFTAHAIPLAMAETSPYAEQLTEAARLVAERVPEAPRPELVYQSRSGPPEQPWLGPDIAARITQLAGEGATAVVVLPLGFVADHMEVVYDLDHVARAAAVDASLEFVRAPTLGTDPRFVAMIRELVLEREGQVRRRALGVLGPWPDTCPPGHCRAPARP
jgi:ferrochelatase